MKKTNISNLKSHLSEYLNVVRAGGEVLVFERKHAFAKITRVGAAYVSQTPELMLELIQSGILEAPKKALPETFFADMPTSKQSAAAALLADRQESL